MVEYHASDPAARARLEARLAGRTLRDAVDDLLRRRGYALDAESVARLYRAPEGHVELFLLAEALIEFDELLTVWRFRHVQMVERVIGGKPGTGGSSGASYLRTTLDKRIFAELWDARSHLEAAHDGK